ncbi:MAG: histidine phosphatase family protein [Spirochaetaceae bacterium]|nr:MAG: histidine phosphatase family protein [Spirochaetaceae bacterium]
MDLYIVRHGQSQDNAAAVQTGDSCLTDLGRRQAAATAEAFRQIAIDRLYVSPAQRAIETASAISDTLDLLPVARADICERGWLYDQPGLSGRQMRQLCNRLQIGPEFPRDRGWAADRDSETADELYCRALHVVHSLRAEHPNGSGSVVLVSHAQFAGYLISAALGFSREQVETNWLRIYNCGISRLEFRDHATMMWYLNAHGHVADLVTV